ncbi:NAD(P)/FAD-dependent oxidoreductase [Streptomyces brasiliensis]|uniref:Ferredoxin reductase n=1 Tax=Streptomyces brasiliensis TaxID=1954 RepID=A0A917L5K3_9ACTN|nr:FAD-dependent oxidoreductase [Streptomyces brasiliensis]GGJ40801.1 ferredoxin reductase [Streptomyces brasiliensis]
MSGGIVVVGASLAGLRVAEALRGNGYTGRLRLVGDEHHLPYDRPPLSKQVLTGEWEASRTALTTPEKLAEAGIETVLGARAVAVDTEAVTLADGDRIDYDQLVVATGAAARTWPGAAPDGRVHRLRTLTDSVRLRTALADDGPMTVVGGGFIGLEVAAAARGSGLDVTVVELASTPLEPVLGPELGACFTRLHRAAGVRVLTGVPITSLQETPDTVAVRLADGTELVAAHVVVGIGAKPNNDWLAGLGLDDAAGVPCDARGRAADRVWALGDVAVWEEPMYGDCARHEHWTTAVDQAAVVAAAVLGRESGRPPALPYFWSTQYDVNFQLVGRPDLASSVHVLEAGEDGSDRGTVFAFTDATDRRVAVAAFHNPRRFLRLRRDLQQELTTAPVRR